MRGIGKHRGSRDYKKNTVEQKEDTGRGMENREMTGVDKEVSEGQGKTTKVQGRTIKHKCEKEVKGKTREDKWGNGRTKGDQRRTGE